MSIDFAQARKSAVSPCLPSNGPLEGTNNKIKTMNRIHYDLRDKEFFRLKLYQLHETKYALVG